jgi:hypothetical protein
MVAWVFAIGAAAMNINPQMPLAWSAIACAVLWGGGMVWWLGSFDPVAIIIFSLGGALFGLCWYLAMRFVFERLRMLPQSGESQANASRGKLYPWIVWATLMVITGIATSCLLDLVNPFIPGGDWHWLIKSLFVVIVWPALMWSLRPWTKRHLPA